MVKAFGTRKLIDRLIITLAFAVILIIILLIFQINLYFQLSKESLIPLKQEYVHDLTPIIQHNKADFRRNVDRSDSSDRDRYIRARKTTETLTETFQDLYDAMERLELDLIGESSSTTKEKSSQSPTLGDIIHTKATEKTNSLELFHMQITANEMYPENSTAVEKLLTDMASLPIQKVEEMTAGTQFKLIITYRNGMRALFKPKRLERDQQNAPNIVYYSEYERHNSEIAGFHVDRLLGFRRALPTCGRIINVITEIMRIGNIELKKTFFKSPKPDENVCFTGNCELFCDNNHPICANGDLLEGSFMAYLPENDVTLKRTTYHPYRRTYSVHEKAEWETNPNFCEKVKKDFPLKESRHLLDFIDTSILDFIIGNADRHNYQVFRVFGNSFHMHYDHGRSFGRPFFDDFSILAPVTQCCLIRSSTLKTLLRYHHGPKPLSMALRESLKNDPIAPVLWEPHLIAVDRRLELVLKEIRRCITNKSIKNVIIY